MDEDAPLDGTTGIALKKKPAAKKITQRAKLDAARLLADDGIPALHTIAKNFKFKGKGHEDEDLSSFILKSQLWANTVFPSLSLSAFIDRTENLCRKTQMKVAFEQMKRTEMCLTGREIEESLFTVQGKGGNTENGNEDKRLKSSLSHSSRRPPVLDLEDADAASATSTPLFSDIEDDEDFDAAINNAFNGGPLNP